MTNPSGLRPCEFNVILRQDTVETKTKGGLLKPEELVDREKWGVTRGTLVDIAPLAFNEDTWPGGVPRPEPGQRVAFARHAGTFVTGEDGEEYRVVKDKDIVALIG